MEQLFQYCHKNPSIPASEALRQFVTTLQNTNPDSMNLTPTMHQQALQAGMQQPPGQRTPGLNGPNQFASPSAGAHLNLPMNTTSASPATINMSPAIQHHALQNHMHQQAPTSTGMIAQQSQQGTNTSVGTGSQGTSANTSPNVPHKRRRPSGVKTEMDDGGGGPEVNGTGNKVKASPRPGGKRQKGAA